MDRKKMRFAFNPQRASWCEAVIDYLKNNSNGHSDMFGFGQAFEKAILEEQPKDIWVQTKQIQTKEELRAIRIQRKSEKASTNQFLAQHYFELINNLNK